MDLYTPLEMETSAPKMSPKNQAAKTAESGNPAQKAQDAAGAAQSMAAASQKGADAKKHPFWDNLSPDNWIADSKVKSCIISGHDFTLLRRKHHCRKCGKIFCHDCITKLDYQGINEKICILCKQEYLKYRKQVDGQISRIRENRNDLDHQDRQLSNIERELGPADYRNLLDENSHIISMYATN